MTARSLFVRASSTGFFIEVPSAKANALNAYLRSNSIGTSPPAPYMSGTDSIELDKLTNVSSVQKLLKLWV
jgi:hypothetical protein